MPVQIGAKAHSFSEPTGLLSDCHRRIEMFLSSLEAVGKVIDQPLTKPAREALEKALQYFQQAAPKHTADEEESLFPRLRSVHSPAVDAALARLDELEQDHRWAESLHGEVDRLGRRWLSGETLSASEIEEFRSAVARLAVMYKRHIALEDDEVFPLAHRLLSAEEKTSIAAEMQRRRA